MELIDQTQSVPDTERALCRVFGVDLPEPKRGVLLELYVQTVLFCRERRFRREQTSALLSIIKSVHEANIETPLDNVDQCLKYSQELLLRHSVRRPPFSVNLFSFEEATCVFKYISNNYLRLYKLYKYVFTPQITLDLSLTYSEPLASEDPSEVDVENVTEQNESEQETSATEQEETSNASVDLKEPTADRK
ncbi:coiled-coil domain-containing protein 189 isoform X2 [Kryptolebias marmoratus]|nr:coiled-coil domain-containing protein 189 isoform X2 [Kryptolebias marmoratus]XP_017273982.1 coiled-coil domain-containing protein 189 isoform X2 [Kryptolebias marmoratus]XP_024862187.1 coiled-coil domain-containing protein 189 isoform X2 [Kryptolebias marmoratus]